MPRSKAGSCVGYRGKGKGRLTPATVVLLGDGGGVACKELGVCTVLGRVADEFLRRECQPVFAFQVSCIKSSYGKVGGGGGATLTYKHGKLHLRHVLLQVRHKVAGVQGL